MATKEQERKALEQIRKIVASLGEDSYIGMAFEGCFEDAEENIENDFALSWKDRAETISKEYDRSMNLIHEVTEENKALKAWAEKAEELFNAKTEVATKYYDCWQRAVETAQDNMAIVEKQEKQIAELENRIINLKAKLYDLMIEEK